MATTMVPETTTAATAATARSDGMRFVAIRANLLPDEVVSARRADVMRKRVLAGLVALALVLVGAYAVSWWQTSNAQSGLDSVQRRGAALQSEQMAFGPLVTAQSKVSSIQSQLNRLMVGDLPWKDMLTTLRSTAPSGITLTQVDGSITVGAAAGTSNGGGGAAGGFDVLNQSGLKSVGTLTMTGAAPDKRSVADYADKLAKVKGLASPFITSVTVVATHSVTFAINAIITSDALGGKYMTVLPVVPSSSSTPGGK